MIDGRTYKPYLLAFTFHQRFHTLHDPHNPVFGRRLSRAFQLESCLCVARPILIVSALQKISSRSVMNSALRGSKFTTTWMRLSKINRSCLSLHKKDTCLFWNQYVFLAGNCCLILLPVSLTGGGIGLVSSLPDRKSENMPDSMSEYLPEQMSETIKIYDVCQDVYNIYIYVPRWGNT